MIKSKGRVVEVKKVFISLGAILVLILVGGSLYMAGMKRADAQHRRESSLQVKADVASRKASIANSKLKKHNASSVKTAASDSETTTSTAVVSSVSEEVQSSVESTETSTGVTQTEAENAALAYFNSFPHGTTDEWVPKVDSSKTMDDGTSYDVLVFDTPQHFVEFTVDKATGAVSSPNGNY